MPSSVATSVPSGPIKEFCIYSLWSDFEGTETNTCANSTRGTVESDFETICCDGWIIDQTQDLWTWHPNRTIPSISLSNLVCCRVPPDGNQAGGLQPIIQGNGMTCTTGTPTPLASLAATNVDNAAGYLVTYTSAAGYGSSIGDYVPTQTPYCLWADTAHGVAMTEVTVEAAQISTPTPTTDQFGYPITTTSSFTRADFTATTSSLAPSSTSAASALAAVNRPYAAFFALAMSIMASCA